MPVPRGNALRARRRRPGEQVDFATKLGAKRTETGWLALPQREVVSLAFSIMEALATRAMERAKIAAGTAAPFERSSHGEAKLLHFTIELGQIVRRTSDTLGRICATGTR